MFIPDDIPPHVTLIAVSKNQPDAKIDKALDAGLRQFGENKVQEAYRHWSTRRTQYNDLTLHLIGPLQSNKAGDAVALFDCIHTVDRLKIAQSLATEMHKQNRSLPCYIQINIGNEEQKHGIKQEELSAFLSECRALHLNIIGLMAIPPFDQDAVPYFAQMQKLAQQHGLHHLSMGMSDDYHDAIAHGATAVRIGSKLFGERI